MAIPAPKPYIAAFEKLGFGMFVHWGLYSQLARGEWTYLLHKMDMKEYEKLKDSFTAEDFNADELVLTAKNAGCKYITLTTRHHEGFSLYDTKGLSDFDVMHSPCGRDLVREYVDACNRHGILPFFYHTTLDWHHPDFENDFDKYLEYLRKSVEILCTEYGKIGGLWFDGNWSRKGADWKENELYATIRRHQPEAMIINNTGLNARGEAGNPEIDSVTFEQDRPTPLNREGMKKYLAAEMCETINDHWGTGSLDFNSKSPATLIENLCLCRKVGANYLLNIGPLAQGAIDPYQKELLAVVGKWLNIFGEAIYEGKPYGAGSVNRNFILKGEGKLYIFFFNPGREGSENVTAGNSYLGAFAFGNVTDKVKRLYWMDNGEELSFAQKENMLMANFTGQPYGKSFCVRIATAEIEK
ncbi:MAG: alpha-L-fucosidase [Clostridia bacterium]|nr:alpha-L-fucosidase [Clostridia bacterium]